MICFAHYQPEYRRMASATLRKLRKMTFRPFARLIVAFAFAAPLGACGSMDALIPNKGGQASTPNQENPSQRTQSGVESHQGPVTEADKIKVLPLEATDLNCPLGRHRGWRRDAARRRPGQPGGQVPDRHFQRLAQLRAARGAGRDQHRRFGPGSRRPGRLARRLLDRSEGARRLGSRQEDLLSEELQGRGRHQGHPCAEPTNWCSTRSWCR